MLLSKIKSLQVGIWDTWIVKAVIGSLAIIFSHNINFLVLLVLLILFDIFAGIYRSCWVGDKGFRFSYLMKGIVDKVIKYTIFLVAVTGFANVYPVASILQKLAYGGLSLYELESIVENLSGEEGVITKVWNNIKGRIFDKFSNDKKSK